MNLKRHMVINSFETREEWLLARKGKITGSRLKDIVVKRGTGKKIGFYELIAERIAIPADNEAPLDRGVRLEPEAMDRFRAETKKQVDSSLVIWSHDDDESIAISPDGFVRGKKKKIEEAVEVKCLASARHIEAWLTKQIPDEYEFQKIQYFIVNDDLKTLHFAFYDPRVTKKDFFVITINRADIEDEIKLYLDYQKATLAEVDAIVKELTF